MVCVSVQGENPRALASGLTPAYMQNHKIKLLIEPTCINLHFVHCEIFDVLEHQSRVGNLKRIFSDS